MAGIKIADITENLTKDANIGNALLPMSLNGESFSVIVNDFFYPNVINAERLATNSINANHISSETVIAKHIQGNAITAAKIAAGAITSREISADTINAIKVSAAQINVNSIVAQVINSLVINTDNFNANSINADIIKGNTVIARHVKSDSIDTNHLQSNSITTRTLKSGSVVAGKLASCSVAATNLVAGAVGAREIAANIIMTGALQSRNYDGFVRNASTDGQDILGYLDAGEKGFFMDDQNGLIVCTDLIARNNIITSNLINFSLTASSLEEVTGDNGEKSIQVSLDDNTLARDPETGKITISNKLVNTEGFFDKSLLLNPNTIFFGMSERQEFKLPTLGVERQPITLRVGDGNGNMNSSHYNNRYNLGLSATWVGQPEGWFTVSDGVYKNRGNFFISTENGADRGSPATYQAYVTIYHPDDNRIHNLPFLGNERLKNPGDGKTQIVTPMQDDDITSGFTFMQDPYANAIRGNPCLFTLDLLQYSPDSVDNMVGNEIELNNLKIKVDTSNIEAINDITSYTYFELKTNFCSNTATNSNAYVNGARGDTIRNSVINPTILRDVYEYTLDIKLGKVELDNGGVTRQTRFMQVYLEKADIRYNRRWSYPGYASLSAVFDTDTNLRFDVRGVVPATTRYDLSSVNCLVPANYHPDNKDEAYNNPTQQRLYVNSGGGSLAFAKGLMVIEHNWLSDEAAMEGYPEIDPNRINPANGLRGYDSPAAMMNFYNSSTNPNDPGLLEIITDRTIPDQNLST
jgi:hypothetical protein